MIKIWFFLLLSFLLNGEVIGSSEGSEPSANSLSLAPPIPLEPQFPLTLTQANRELLIDNPKQLEKSKLTIQHYLEKHSFPWLTMAILLVGAGAGWTLYLTREHWPKLPVKPISTTTPKQQIEQTLQGLEKIPGNQDQMQTYYVQLASVLLETLQVKLGWSAQKFTTNELIQTIRNQSLLSSQQIEEVFSLLTKIDQVKFAGKKPLPAEAAEIFQKIKIFIKKLL